VRACARNQWLRARDRARDNERAFCPVGELFRDLSHLKRTTIAIDETNDDRDRFRVEPIDFSR